MSRKTRKLIWSAPLVAVLAIAGALAIFAAQPPTPAAADNPAGVPTDVMVEPAAGNDGRTMLVIDWTAPADVADDPVFGYRIDVSEDGHVWQTLEANTENTDTTYPHTVKGAVAPGNTMYYRVFAINTAGVGPVSKTVSGTTKPETPPMAPTNFTATAAGPEQINLSWSRPDDDGGQPITGYCVHISARAVQDAVAGVLPTATAADPCAKDTNADTTTGAFGTQIVKVDADMTSYAHKKLDELRAYQYRVFAMNKHGADADHDSATRQAKTTEAVQPGAPTGLTAVRQADGVVDLYWYAPASDGGAATGTAADAASNGITGYRVEVTKKRNTWPASTADAAADDTSGTSSVDISGGDDTAVISITDGDGGEAYNLRHTTGFDGTADDTLYYRVFTVTGASRGAPYTRSNSGNSASVSLVAKATQPEPVTNIRLDDVEGSETAAATSVSYDKNKISWMAGAPNAGGTNKTTSYRIDISSNGNDWSQVAGDTRLTSPQYTHEELEAAKGWHYRIVPFNGSTPGVAAKSQVFTTLAAAAPEAVDGLRAMAVNPGQIDLTWNMVTEDNGAKITNYRIHRLASATTELGSDASNTATYNVIKTVEADVTSYSDKGREQDTKYYYAVVAINMTGGPPPAATASARGEVVNATTPEAVKPGAPMGLVTESAKDSNLEGSGDRGVLLVWNSPGNPAGASITGYRIDRKVIGTDTDFVQLEGSIDAARTFYTDALEPAADEMRVYRVSAINTIGVGPVSNESYYPHEQPHTFGPPNEPPMPVGEIRDQMLTVGGTVDLDLSMYFNDPEGDALTYSVGSSDRMIVTGTYNEATGMATLEGVAAGTATIGVTATDADGSGMSAEQSFMVTVTAAPPALMAPTNIRVNASGSGIVLVDWDPVADAAGFYIIATNLADTSDQQTAVINNPTATAGAVNDLTVGAEYLIIVYSFRSVTEFKGSDHIRVIAE